MNWPSVSLIIASYQRPQQLVECLANLEMLDYPRERLEIIVIDDGSTPPYAPLLQDLSERLPLLMLRQKNGGPSVARNAGASHSSGELLAFTDDDCYPRPDWLKILVVRQQQVPEAMIGGYTMNGLVENPYASASQRLIDILYAHYNADPQQARFFTGNNMLMRRVDFEAVGGFSPLFRQAAAEDRNICARWLASGRPLIYVPEAQILHRHNLNLRKFWRQHMLYARGAIRFQRSLTVEELPRRFEVGLHLLILRHILQESMRNPRLAALLSLTQMATVYGLLSGLLMEAWQPGQVS